MPRITYNELKAYQDFLQRTWEYTSPGIQLVGATKPMTEGEMMAFACLKASLTIWNKRGMLSPDWESKINLENLYFDSTPMCDE